MFLRDYETATTTLSQAWQEVPDPEYAVALSRSYLSWWDAKMRESQRMSADDVTLLEHAVRYCPASIELANRLRKARELIAASDMKAFERVQAIVRTNYAATADSKL